MPQHVTNQTNVMSFFRGEQFEADVFLERIDDSRLPSADAEEKEYSKLASCFIN